MSKINKEAFQIPHFLVFEAKGREVKVECYIRPTDEIGALATEVYITNGKAEITLGYFNDLDEAVDACEVFATGFAFVKYEVNFVKGDPNGAI
jgi:hypothetical protein